MSKAVIAQQFGSGWFQIHQPVVAPAALIDGLESENFLIPAGFYRVYETRRFLIIKIARV